MKTILPTEVKTEQEAKDFLTELHSNSEAFHPEDNAHTINWRGLPPTTEECNQLNKLMAQIYELDTFDPCDFLISLDNNN